MDLAKNILLDILAPILLMVLLGAVLRWKFKLDMSTLSKLNIYIFTPAFVFHKVSTSQLALNEMAGVVILTIVQVAILGILVWGIGIALHINPKTLAAIAMGVMFYNSANYGLPLAELAFPRSAGVGRDGGEVQAFVLLTQNLLTFTVGLCIAAWAGSGNIFGGMKTVFRLPIIPALLAGLLARWWAKSGEGHAIPIFIGETGRYLAGGLVPMALTTLGAQLATNPRWPRWRPISMVLFLRLVYGPIQMGLILFTIHWFGWGQADMWPWPAQTLILTAAVPTAVNTLLLTLELNGDADLAADCVFWTTIFSMVTITIWLVIVKSSLFA